MSKTGYYRVHLEVDGFKTPFVVYAVSDQQAAVKAFDDVGDTAAKIFDIEGPYLNIMAMDLAMV